MSEIAVTEEEWSALLDRAAGLDAWTPQAFDRLLDALRNPGPEERKFRRWEIRQQARARKQRRGWP